MKAWYATMPDEVREFYRQAAAQRRREDRPCEVCGVLMPQVTARRRYCSIRCHHAAARRRQRHRAETAEPT